MKLQIVRRWGTNQPGNSVDVADSAQARWLLDNSYAVRANQPETAYGNAAAPGAAGPDPLAGGDHTRRRPATRKAEYGHNRALPTPGAPVQYNMGVAAAAAGAGASDSTGDADEAKIDKPKAPRRKAD